MYAEKLKIFFRVLCSEFGGSDGIARNAFAPGYYIEDQFEQVKKVEMNMVLKLSPVTLRSLTAANTYKAYASQ